MSSTKFAMSKVIHIKTQRLHRRIFEAEQMLSLLEGRPYNWYVQCESYRWQTILKHRVAMLNHFNSIAHN